MKIETIIKYVFKLLFKPIEKEELKKERQIVKKSRYF